LKLGIPKKKLGISQEEVGDFPHEEVGDFQMMLPFGIWIIGVAPRRVRKMNWSIEVRTSKVRVVPFGLSPVIRLGLRNQRKKERKIQPNHWTKRMTTILSPLHSTRGLETALQAPTIAAQGGPS